MLAAEVVAELSEEMVDPEPDVAVLSEDVLAGAVGAELSEETVDADVDDAVLPVDVVEPMPVFVDVMRLLDDAVLPAPLLFDGAGADCVEPVMRVSVPLVLPTGTSVDKVDPVLLEPEIWVPLALALAGELATVVVKLPVCCPAELTDPGLEATDAAVEASAKLSAEVIVTGNP